MTETAELTGVPVQKEEEIVRENFTDKVRVTGLPLLLKGWNGIYYKTDEISEGFPVYRLDPYMLYYIFPILGVKLAVYNGKWTLERDEYSLMFTKRNNKKFFGEWGYYGMKIVPIP